MNVAELLVTSLQQAGVTTAYGVPGEENTHLMKALENSSIDVVLTRHEQAAAFMASVHARLTQKPAMCFATLGPGATNLVTGVADAHLDQVPMIVVTGQGARSRLALQESHQLIDLDALFEPVTKFSRTLMQEAEVGGLVAEALRLAQDPHPGAVHLSLPEDLAEQEACQKPFSLPEVTVTTPAPKALGRAIEVLSKAKRPLVVAGNGVVRAGAEADLIKFIETTNIPLATTFMAKGLLPADHPLHLHCVGQPFEDHVDEVIETRDLVIAVGFDPVELPPSAITNDGEIPVLHIGALSAALEHGWDICADVHGDVGQSLRGVTAAMKGHVWPEDAQVQSVVYRIAQQRRREHGASADGALHPADVLRVVEGKLERDGLVLSGVGTHKMEIARYLAAQQSKQVIIPNGLAGMGLALPGAIAAARLGRHGRVFAICGDGDFLMNVQDMETAHRLGLSLTVILWEDSGYGLIKAKQRADTGSHTELSFGNPDWSALATSFGWKHVAATSIDKLDEALEDHTTGLTLVTLPIDYSDALSRDDSPSQQAA